MKNNSHQTNGLIDAALFAGFILACFLELTGQEAHQWLGLAIGGLAVYHLWRHQAWALAVTRRWLSGLAGRARLYALLDAALLAGMGAIIASGVVISSWLNLALTNYAVWRDWHVGITVTTLGLLVAKLGLHWRWIAQTLRPAAHAPVVAAPSAAKATVPVMAGAPVKAAALSRRDFLQVMGVVSAAAVLAGTRALSSQSGTVAVAAASTTAEQKSSTTTTASSSSQPAASSSAATCQVRCNRRCSYPGHCRRYTDANGNGRCDLGECS